eukprot:COSAG04_NODE_89_length_27118_cov_11.171176_14_plen_525_part_00
MPGERGEGAAAAAPALRRQLFLILALRCLRTASFAQPVLVVWFAAVGVSPAGVLWLSSAYSALVILAEVPSGVISDGLGRRRTLLWAFVALSGSFGAAALADRALWLLGASLVLKAVGAALFSGTDMALLYETIKRYKQASEVKEEAVAVESIHIFAVAVTEALFATIGGVMADRCGLQVRQHPSAGVSPTIIHRFWSSRRRWGSLCCRSRPVRGSRCCSRMTRWLPAPTPAHLPLAGGGLATALGYPRPALVACSQAVWCVPMPALCCPFPCSSTSGSAPCGQGVNCATYVAATALNPLLWRAGGLPTVHFGWLSASNNLVSAATSLAAPLLSRAAASLTGAKAQAGSVEVMERVLLGLLAVSALAYALMSGSARSLGGPAGVGAMVGGGLVLSAVRGVCWPLLGTAINGAVRCPPRLLPHDSGQRARAYPQVEDDSKRATTLSLFAGMIKVATVCATSALGLLLDLGDGGATAAAVPVEPREAEQLSVACGACTALLVLLLLAMGALLRAGVGGGDEKPKQA